MIDLKKNPALIALRFLQDNGEGGEAFPRLTWSRGDRNGQNFSLPLLFSRSFCPLFNSFHLPLHRFFLFFLFDTEAGSQSET